FEAVAAAFGSLGRVCLALDAEFRIRHVSPRLDALLGPGSVQRYRGRPIAELLGHELFGAAGPMRQALSAGERREGWRAFISAEPAGSRLVSVSAAPLEHVADACDEEARFLVVLRPAEEDEATRSGAPTAFAGIIARSRPILRVMRLVESLQHSEVTVLLTGESGVGKGVIAQAVHASSARRGGPFVAVNCAALPEALLESELFGHVRGAFTGATRDRVGRFELAGRGTLFLDEIGDLPLHLQAKLLRVIQERVFERVGDSRSVSADVRVLAATHRDLRRAVADGRFREDLYYRLHVFPIHIPSLRERREDIEPLARYLQAQISRRSGRALRFSPEALRAVLAYRWPGNVRELENALEYASTVAQGQTLQPEDLPPEVLGDADAPVGVRAPVSGHGVDGVSAPAGGPTVEGPPRPAKPRGRDAPAREVILATLNAHRWRMMDAARALGVSRTTLWRWLRDLELLPRRPAPG
ncbi:MAG TPA: sigma 54-interacting transcriptional regulator, partial [Anaeromyxobacteraceae bacterium]|nr:sigma 54-interacting transcriptional regulator [Anaeromyxobacteraceae bacterium]